MSAAPGLVAPVVLAVLLLASLAGVALLWLGLRGRRVDDHPLCRRCRFDLTGLPPDSRRCPECGADLAAPRSRVVGHRRRRTGWVAAGTALLVLGIGGSGTVAWRVAQSVEWVRYEPFGWVAADARSTLPATRDPAITELARRLSAGELSDARAGDLADLALAEQGDRSKPWAAGWHGVVDTLLAGGHLSGDRLDRYLAQGVVVALGAKPTVRRGRPISVRLHLDATRLSPSAHVQGMTSGGLRLGDAVIDDDFADSPPEPGRGLAPTYTRGTSATLAKRRTADLPEGRLDLAVDLIVHVDPLGNAKWGVSPPPVGVGAGPGEAVVPVRASVPVALAGGDAVVDAFESDPAARGAVRAAFPAARVWTGDDGRTRVAVRVDRLLVAVSAEVFLRPAAGDERAVVTSVAAADGGGAVGSEGERRVGPLRVGAGGPSRWHAAGGAGSWRGGLRAETVDVVLRPSQAAADGAEAMGTYWGEPVVIGGVTVDAPHVPPLNADESLRSAVEAAVSVRDVRVGESSIRSLTFGLRFEDAPVRLAYRVAVRPSGDAGAASAESAEEVGSGAISVRGGRGTIETRGVSLPLPAVTRGGVPPERIDVILRPDPEWEFRGDDPTPPWAGEVVIRDVPLPPPGGAALPGPFRPGGGGATGSP